MYHDFFAFRLCIIFSIPFVGQSRKQQLCFAVNRVLVIDVGSATPRTNVHFDPAIVLQTTVLIFCSQYTCTKVTADSLT